MGDVIQYVSLQYKRVISTFLGLVHLCDGSAETIVNAVDKYICKIELQPARCVSIGSDNAFVIVGIYGGVHTLLE